MASVRKMKSTEILVQIKHQPAKASLAYTSQPGLLLLDVFCWVLGMNYSCRDPGEQHPSMVFLGIES